MPLLSDLGNNDLYPASAAFAQKLFERRAILKIDGNVNFKRDIICRVILNEHLTKEFARVERVVFGQILPKELAASYNSSFAHGKQLKCEPLFLAIKTENIFIAFSR